LLLRLIVLCALFLFSTPSSYGFVADDGRRDRENVIKVIDLPDIKPFLQENGQFMDLGYRFTALSGGEWVGYVGGHRKFIRLTQDQLKSLLYLSGIRRLPPTPTMLQRLSFYSGEIASLVFSFIFVAVWHFWGRFQSQIKATSDARQDDQSANRIQPAARERQDQLSRLRPPLL
jgi:hypothetical protein